MKSLLLQRERFQRARRGTRGFTVLEVTVSMVVLGLLAYALNQALTGG